MVRFRNSKPSTNNPTRNEDDSKEATFRKPSKALAIMILALVVAMNVVATAGTSQVEHRSIATKHNPEQQVSTPSVDESRQLRPRTRTLTGLWKERFRNGGGFLFFKHIRKAAGSSMNNYIAKALRYHSRHNDASKNNNKVVKYHQEFSSMHWQCPTIDPRWNQTLSMIVLRHPLERHLSEFFYSGYKPQTKQDAQLGQWYKAKNFTTDFYQLLERHLQPWMDQGMHLVRQRGLLHRHFTDEFQVRALTGETDDRPGNHECVSNGGHGPNDHPYGPDQFCKGPCDYGGPWPELPDWESKSPKAEATFM